MKGAGRWCSGEVRSFWVGGPGWAGWNPGGEPPHHCFSHSGAGVRGGVELPQKFKNPCPIGSSYSSGACLDKELGNTTDLKTCAPLSSPQPYSRSPRLGSRPGAQQGTNGEGTWAIATQWHTTQREQRKQSSHL
ncbi:hypothetical protein AWN80_18665 [Clostridioides difficile]|nr:hypothetical protein AWN80_18665 [Clostridioides difficile]